MSGGVDPSKLHLKKELNAIRKAARVLRDPGTTSSWRSPLSSTRSGAAVSSTWINNNLKVENNGGKEKRVLLYNWKTHKSSSEKSRSKRGGGDDDDDNCSISQDDSSSDTRSVCDSKSDTYIRSMIFRRGDTNLLSAKSTASTTNTTTKKRDYNAVLTRRHRQRQQLGLNSVEQSDDSLSRSFSEEFRAAASPLLSRLRRHNKKPLVSRTSFKGDSSYSYSTPALSTASFNRRGNRNPSTVGSWDATTTPSFNNDWDNEVDDDHLDFPGQHGCGIPCYWSSAKRTPKQHRGGACGSCYSPSFSDTLRRKGGSILCGSRARRRYKSSSVSSNRRKMVSRSAQGLLPLLASSGDGRGGRSSLGTRTGPSDEDDDLSTTNFGELDLEGLSRLDGRRWSSQQGLELVPINREAEEGSTPENIRTLSHKYRPMFFDELIGQNIVVQSLVNAISRGRIAPVYLFQGPRGTGKTSMARIFSAALNCLATEETKPCGYCRECADFMSGKTRYLREVDGNNKKGIDRVRYLLKNLPVKLPHAFSPFMVFVIDECHLLPSKTWVAFLKYLEHPPSRVVFIFITTDLDNVPRTILSRCQKYIFNKIKDGDIVSRLRKISSEEKLEAEHDALDLIALNADGALRDAETMLDQLSLLGKRITASLVNELVGVVSDEKLLELLELAMSSDTAETVKRARELMDLGIDPMVLMSQLASLIMDIISGTHHMVDAKSGDPFFGERKLSEAELEKLKRALKLLSEAEKQLRVSSERSTWFTATLLQLGSVPSPDPTLSSSSRRHSSKTTEEDPSSTSRDGSSCKQKSTCPAFLPKAVTGSCKHQLSLVDDFISKPIHSRLMSGGDDDDVDGDDDDDVMLGRCISSKKLEHIWGRCIERCHSKTLRQLLRTYGKLVSLSVVEGVVVAYIAFGDREIKSRAERFVSSVTNSFEIVLRRNVEIRIILETETSDERGRKSVYNNSNTDLDERQDKMKHQIPMQRIESIIREQRLETAWLQTAEKSTPGRLKLDKNQIMPQETNSLDSDETKNFKQTSPPLQRLDHYPMSPSLLHSSSFSKESLGYESSSGGTRGCSGLFCWNNTKPQKRAKVKQGNPVRPPTGEGGRFSLFGDCVKSKKTGNVGRR